MFECKHIPQKAQLEKPWELRMSIKTKNGSILYRQMLGNLLFHWLRNFHYIRYTGLA